MTNLQLLLDRYKSLTLDTDQIMEILKISNRNVFFNMSSAGRLPFKTYRAAGTKKRLANIKDVAEWMDSTE